MRYEDLLDEAADMGVRVEERPLHTGRCGCYYNPARLIIIDEGMPDYQKACTLAHELVHAKHQDHGHGDAKAECRAKRETALQAVDALKYATAERIYGGDTYLIAQALDVTVQVIEDYKILLHDGCAAYTRKGHNGVQNP